MKIGRLAGEAEKVVIEKIAAFAAPPVQVMSRSSVASSVGHARTQCESLNAEKQAISHAQTTGGVSWKSPH
jgi:predicted P-loop ATPase/GTPase